MISPAGRTHGTDTTRNLLLARMWVDQSGVVDLLKQEEKPKGRGRPISLAQYNFRSQLITLTEMVIAGRPISYREMAYRINFFYTTRQLEMIGLPGFRDAKRCALMKGVAHIDPDDPGTLKFSKTDADGFRTWKSEYTRCRDSFESAVELMNDNVLPANKRQNVRELRTVKEAGGKEAQTKLRERVANRLVAASIETANRILHPEVDATDLQAGVLADWKGDIAIDETPIDQSISVYQKEDGDDRSHPVHQMAEYAAKNRRMKWPYAVGLHLGITTGRYDGKRVPNLALSMRLHHPSKGTYSASLHVIDAIQAMGHRPSIAGRGRQYLVVDGAYQGSVGWNEAISTVRGYSPVFKYAKGDNVLHPLTSDADAGKAKLTTCHLYNGVPLCPAITKRSLENTRLAAPKRITGDEDLYDAKELLRHDRDLQRIAVGIMPTHGRPEVSLDRSGGRPKIGVRPTEEKIFKVRVMCPAEAGRVRCPLKREADSWKKPELDLLAEANESIKTSACEGGKCTTIRLSESQYKQYQPLLVGSWEHEDFYGSARARNEAFHALLIRPEGGNLRRGQIRFWKNAPYTIAVALSVGLTNLQVIEKWNENIDIFGDEAPDESHRFLQRIRENIIAAYRRR